MKGLRLLLISLTFVGAGCHTPATRTVIQRPFSEVKTAVVAFVKSYEERPKPAEPNTQPFQPLFTLKTNALDLSPYFEKRTGEHERLRRGDPVRVTLDLRPANSHPPEFRIMEIVDNGKPPFKIVFLWLQPLNSFGPDQVEIEVRPTNRGHARVCVRASNNAVADLSSSRLIFCDHYRETETLLHLCHAMEYGP